MPDLDGPLVEKWEQWYATRPDYVARMVERSRRYLYHIVAEVERRDMPLEIALLPMVESAFNPTALSVARASGIWQFMPSTGKHYGLKQNWWFDSRRDVVAATDTALDYLQKLHDEFGDWQLALAAYNWGEGNVAPRDRAEPGARACRPTTRASRMPAETRNYLPEAAGGEEHRRATRRSTASRSPTSRTRRIFTVVKTTRKMDVKRAAELAELPLEEFLALNPQHNRPVIAGADEYTILLPIDNAEIFAAKLELIDQPLVSWQAYRLKAGETLPQVAAKYGDVGGDAARGQRHRRARAGARRAHAARAVAAAELRSRRTRLSKAVFTTVPAGRTFYYTRAARRHAARRSRRATACRAQELRQLERPDAEPASRPGRSCASTSDVGRASRRSRGKVATRDGQAERRASAAPRQPRSIAAKRPSAAQCRRAGGRRAARAKSRSTASALIGARRRRPARTRRSLRGRRLPNAKRATHGVARFRPSQ